MVRLATLTEPFLVPRLAMKWAVNLVWLNYRRSCTHVVSYYAFFKR